MTREVYARFGLAYYLTEVIHSGLVIRFATHSLDRTTATRPWVEERMKVASAMTLGELVGSILPTIDPSFHESLRKVVKLRNGLAHGFWFSNIHRVHSESGQLSMLNELSEMIDELSKIDKALDLERAQTSSDLGLTQEHFIEHQQEVLRNGPAPLPDRRVLKTDERLKLVRVWTLPSSQGGWLVFQDSAGQMWQLCDLGLGWLYRSEPDSAWKPADKFDGLLPAEVNARPKGAQRWNFKIHFSTGALLCVSRESEDAPVVVQIQRTVT